MRRRHSTGSVVKQRGRWKGYWYENGTRKTKIIGLAKEMTKGEAKAVVMKIVADHCQIQSGFLNFSQFVEGPYFDFYSRKWKASTSENNKQRIRTHLVALFKDRALSSFKRDELQDLLDSKRAMSFSVVDHLRWDTKQIFDMAVAEGHIERNPALLLFTPREAKKPVRRVMTMKEV